MQPERKTPTSFRWPRLWTTCFRSNRWLREGAANARGAREAQKRKPPRQDRRRHRKYRWLRGQDLNLRPSGYEPDELPGCSTPRHWGALRRDPGNTSSIESVYFSRFGGDLLSHILRCSTIGVTALNGRVREGIGCLAVAIATKPEKKQEHRSFWATVQGS